MISSLLSLIFVIFGSFLIMQQAALAEETLTDKGNAFLESGKYKEAITFYDKIVETQPNDTDILYNKAVALYLLGNFSDSIVYYDKILVMEPDATDALVGKADSLAQLAKYEEAIKLYDKVLEINSTDAYASSMKKVAKDALNIEKLIGNQ